MARFGARMGGWLKARAEFHDDSPVESSRLAKSRSSETTFDTDVDDLDALRETVRKLAADVCEGLRRKDTRGRTIGIKLRYDDFTNITRDRSIDAFTNDLDRVTAVALELLRGEPPGAAGAPDRRACRVVRGRDGRAAAGAAPGRGPARAADGGRRGAVAPVSRGCG